MLKYKYVLFILLLLLIVPVKALSEEEHCPELNLFQGELRQMLSPVVAGFAERYLSERINSKANSNEMRRRLEFDEVQCSFPITKNAIQKLQTANGISVTFDRGRKYKIVWFVEDKILGEMSFPASYNLIMFTDQVKSHQLVVDKLCEMCKKQMDSIPEVIGQSPDSRHKPFKRLGSEFYLRHLRSDTYHDSISGYPIWSKEFPSESLANLFVHSRNVANVVADVEIVAYDGKSDKLEVPMNVLRKFFEESGELPYFGVSEIQKSTGDIEALAVFHNTSLAYIHKLEIKASPKELWSGENYPHIYVKFMPFIKLHNLNNLWGEK